MEQFITSLSETYKIFVVDKDLIQSIDPNSVYIYMKQKQETNLFLSCFSVFLQSQADIFIIITNAKKMLGTVYSKDSTIYGANISELNKLMPLKVSFLEREDQANISGIQNLSKKNAKSEISMKKNIDRYIPRKVLHIPS